MFLECIYILGL